MFLRFVIVHREFQDGEDCVTDVCRFGVKKKQESFQSSVCIFSNSLLFNPQPINKKKMATNITFHPGKQSPLTQHTWSRNNSNSPDPPLPPHRSRHPGRARYPSRPEGLYRLAHWFERFRQGKLCLCLAVSLVSCLSTKLGWGS